MVCDSYEPIKRQKKAITPHHTAAAAVLIKTYLLVQNLNGGCNFFLCEVCNWNATYIQLEIQYNTTLENNRFWQDGYNS